MCFWPVTFKRGGLRYWVKFAEKYGMPWAVGKQPRNTPAPETDRLLDQLEAMIEDAVAVIPDDASVELMQAGGTSGNADAYEKLLMFCRSEVAIALLGQNQSTEATSTRASATAGLDVAAELRDGDKAIVESTLNQFIRWIVDVNEGEGAPAPKFEMWEETEVSKAQAERDEILSRAGVRFTPAYWRRTYELQEGDIETAPVPPTDPVAPANPRAPAENGKTGVYKQPEGQSSGDGEVKKFDASLINAYSMGLERFVRLGVEVDQAFVRGLFDIPAPAPGAALLKAPEPAAMPAFAEGAGADASASVADQLATAAQGVVDGWLDQVKKIADEAPDLETLQQRILAAFGELPDADLVEVMSAAFAAARAAGMDDSRPR